MTYHAVGAVIRNEHSGRCEWVFTVVADVTFGSVNSVECHAYAKKKQNLKILRLFPSFSWSRLTQERKS